MYFFEDISGCYKLTEPKMLNLGCKLFCNNEEMLYKGLSCWVHYDITQPEANDIFLTVCNNFNCC